MLKKIIYIFIVIVAINRFCLSYSDEELNKIEYQKYGHVFVEDSLSVRLNRLESDYFGMAQSGNIEQRINKLIQISNHSKQANFSYPDYPINKKSKLKNFLNNTAEFFGSGYMTGFTPSFTGSGYNYAENMYRNEYKDFIRNYSGYCPYYNRYYSNAYNTAPISAYTPHSPYIQNNGLNNRYRQIYYAPPNIYTGSSVHIIKD